MNAANLLAVTDLLKHHAERGVYVVLDGRDVSIVAQTECTSVTVKLQPQRVSGGKGVFFLPFDDLYNCRNAFKHEGAVDVVLSRSEQPLVPGTASLLIRVSDWFEAHAGYLQRKGLPKLHKSGVKQDVRVVAHSIRPFAAGRNYAHQETAGVLKVWLDEPGFGLLSVIKEVH